MADDKFILIGLDDERSKHVAEVLKNPTCKKILNFLGEVKEASEKDISDSLNMPINTVEYNLKKIIKSGLVKSSKNFFWSVKGKKIPMYKLARKHIIISPNKNPDINYIKTLLPVVFLAVLAIILASLFLFPKSVIEKKGESDLIKQFSSQEELNDFLRTSQEFYMQASYSGGFFDGLARLMKSDTASFGVPEVSNSIGQGSASDYSATNIQVEGVDEADIVKNDGRHIYVVSKNKVIIVDAYPAENMEILSEINFSNSVSEIFINKNKLIVFSGGYNYAYFGIEAGEMAAVGCYGGCSGKYKSIVSIYDISNKKEPKLENTIESDGNYVDSRMIGDYVYVISAKYINAGNPEPPVYSIGGSERKISASEVYYIPYPDHSYIFTSISAINTDNGEFNSRVYLTGSTNTIYVSKDNIYLAHQKSLNYDKYAEELAKQVYYPVLPGEYDDRIRGILDSDKNAWEKIRDMGNVANEYSESLEGEELGDFSRKLADKLEGFKIKIQKELEKTVIHKIGLNKENIEHAGKGEVPGKILNQFSMDEYEGYFRVATTTGQWGEDSLNHVYVLNNDLNIVGSLEDLAEGERVFSARFMGNRAYLVTFEAIDPFFVIDLSNPKNPEVLGYLKIPGYSDYLHPYDENHVIGIGKDVNASIDEDKTHSSHVVYYTAILGVKVSLFDVSDVENPIEISKYVIGERGTESPVLYDHKAFLFDREKQLLVLPVQVSELKPSKHNPEYMNPRFVWQGAYVFNINEGGISLRGKISHDEKTAEDYYPNYQFSIQRSLYMDDVLYTLSLSKIKANNLDTIEEISSVDLGYAGYWRDIEDYPPVF